MTRITIPQLDANIVDVTVTCWRKQPGDTIKAGEILADLTTDKAAYELEAPDDGILLAIYASEKSIVPTGYVMGLIGRPGERDPAAESLNEARLAAYHGASSTDHPQVREPGSRIRATPRARRLAREHGIDLAKVQSETGAEVIDEALLASYLHPPPPS